MHIRCKRFEHRKPGGTDLDRSFPIRVHLQSGPRLVLLRSDRFSRHADLGPFSSRVARQARHVLWPPEATSKHAESRLLKAANEAELGMVSPETRLGRIGYGVTGNSGNSV
jgi:hypothetical protein